MKTHTKKLSKTLQRYENKSKSQLDIGFVFADSSCLRLCKDTKIKANHNENTPRLYMSKVV